MARGMPLNCYRCGRFVGPDGDADVFYDHYAGGWEAGYSRCGRCVREDRAARLPGGCRAARGSRRVSKLDLIRAGHTEVADGQCGLCDVSWPCDTGVVLAALAAAVARAEQSEAALAAERERNQPLRDRIKALQDQHDQDTRALKKALGRYQTIWEEAERLLGEDRYGYWWHPSEYQKAVYGILEARAEQAERERDEAQSLLRDRSPLFQDYEDAKRDNARFRARLATVEAALDSVRRIAVSRHEDQDEPGNVDRYWLCVLCANYWDIEDPERHTSDCLLNRAALAGSQGGNGEEGQG